jgi:hypothetical protein
MVLHKMPDLFSIHFWYPRSFRIEARTSEDGRGDAWPANEMLRFPVGLTQADMFLNCFTTHYINFASPGLNPTSGLIL